MKAGPAGVEVRAPPAERAVPWAQGGEAAMLSVLSTGSSGGHGRAPMQGQATATCVGHSGALER